MLGLVEAVEAVVIFKDVIHAVLVPVLVVEVGFAGGANHIVVQIADRDDRGEQQLRADDDGEHRMCRVAVTPAFEQGDHCGVDRDEQNREPDTEQVAVEIALVHVVDRELLHGKRQ